jgi:hypothetical protein
MKKKDGRMEGKRVEEGWEMEERVNEWRKEVLTALAG